MTRGYALAKRPKSKAQTQVGEPGHGVLVRAANGDVIRYDQSGLIMRLSDKVIRDIALRLGHAGPASMEETSHAAVNRADPHDQLEGIDAWDLRVDGDWLIFSAHLPGKQGVRTFRRAVEGGEIIADTPGPLIGILGIGGARAAHARDGAADFPQHVLAPADDIGAVGHAGVDRGTSTGALEHLREMTHEALVADTFLSWQMEKHAPLPLFLTRVETDTSATTAALASGPAFENLLIGVDNLKRAAAALGKTAKILAISVDFALEDMSGSATAYRDGMLELMRKVEEELRARAIDRPVFVFRFESGSAEITQSPAIEGQWELVWNHGEHQVLFSAPGYMFAYDEYDRPTPEAQQQMAEMTAAALAEPDIWQCPTFYLAERDPKNDKTVRVVARAAGPLSIDPDDPMAAGKLAGFSMTGATNGAKITKISVDPEDPQALVLHLDKHPTGDGIQIRYAYGAEPRNGPYPANCGAVRDNWQMTSATGRNLHRWALPCILPLQNGGGTPDA